MAILIVATFLLATRTVIAQPADAGSAGDSWTTRAPMLVARGGLGVAVVDGKIYAIGGSTVGTNLGSYRDGGVVAVNEVYDPTTNTWNTKTPMPTPRAYFATAVYQNKIYCIGGFTKVNTTNGGYLQQATNVNEVYDPATDTWSTKSPMPTARAYLQANAVDGKIYLLGGRDNAALNEAYDPVNDSWTTKSAIPSTDYFYGSAVIGNTIYAFVGTENRTAGFKSKTDIYDTLTDSWSSRASVSIGWGSKVAATNGVLAPRRIFVMSGWAEMATHPDGTGSQPYMGDPAKGNQIYDPENDVWATGKNKPTNVVDYTLAVVNDKLYAIGGIVSFYPITFGWSLNNDTPSAVNEEYTPAGYGTPDIAYTLEITPPKISITSPINQTYNQTSVTLSYTADKPLKLTSYSLDGNENISFTGDANVTKLSVGLHNITVYTQDTYGNVAASQTIDFTIAEPFPVMQVIAVLVVVVLVGVGLLIYLRKIRR